MYKNTGSQKVLVFAFADAGHATADAGEPITGDAANITGTIEQDNDGTHSAITDTNPTEIASGFYRFDLSEAETNGDQLFIKAVSATAGVQVVVCPSSVIYTRPPNFSTLGIESDGDLTKVNTLDGHTAQTGDSYAVVAHADYGNAQLVRSTTPENTFDVNATGEAGLDLDNTSGTIDAAQLGADCITAAKIADSAFVAENFAANSLDGKGDWSTHDAAAVLTALGNGSWATEAGGTGDQLTAIPLHSDLQDGGRLDLIIDAIAGDVENIDGAAMRGTDGANTVVPDAEGTAATLHGITDGKIDTVDSVADAIKAKTDNLPASPAAVGSKMDLLDTIMEDA